jgi:ATP-binding cassette subfamily B protein
LNGAGNTTLIKLLCGFYRPDSGVIRIDGINLQDMSPRDLRAHISVLFQEAMRYNVSARDNIACGDIERQDKDVERAACAAAADGIITQLEQGYDTPLGKTMGGAELSGGEWQRLALARAFLRDAPLLLLDEPTSAMDSWTESGWFERFRDHAQGRTVVLITHRFTSARLANRIFVVDGGAVIESGTHDELLKQGGAYALAWYTQNDQQERANLASGANQPLPT